MDHLGGGTPHQKRCSGEMPCVTPASLPHAIRGLGSRRSRQGLGSIPLPSPDRLAATFQERAAEPSPSAVTSPCWNVRNSVCGVGVGHTGPKGFGHRHGNTWTHTTVCVHVVCVHVFPWTHTTVCFNGFSIPNLKFVIFFLNWKLCSSYQASNKKCITLAIYNKYLLW